MARGTGSSTFAADSIGFLALVAPLAFWALFDSLGFLVPFASLNFLALFATLNPSSFCETLLLRLKKLSSSFYFTLTTLFFLGVMKIGGI
jgi:hypothetical protein